MCALRTGHAVFPVRIQEVQPGPKLEYLLEGIHWMDAWTPPFEAHLERLSQLIEAKVPSMHGAQNGANATGERQAVDAAAKSAVAGRRDVTP